MSLDSIRTWIMYNNQFILYTHQVKIIIFFTLHGTVVLKASAFDVNEMGNNTYRNVKFQRRPLNKYPKAEFKIGKIPYGYLLLTNAVRVEIDKEPLEIRIINNSTDTIISKFSLKLQEGQSNPVQINSAVESGARISDVERHSNLYCSVNNDSKMQHMRYDDKNVAIGRLLNSKGCLFLKNIKRFKRTDLSTNKRVIKSA